MKKRIFLAIVILAVALISYDIGTQRDGCRVAFDLGRRYSVLNDCDNMTAAGSGGAISIHPFLGVTCREGNEPWRTDVVLWVSGNAGRIYGIITRK